MRTEIVGVLKSSKPPASNISKDERRAIKSLQDDKSIMVLGADKGRATVILDKSVYHEKMLSLLSDTKTYKKLDKDPTPKHKKELVSILHRLEKEDKIRKEDKQYLYPTTEYVPRIYGSPKIHKDGTPLRPIVDFTGSIGYNVAKSLADILGPLVGKTEHHVLNSKCLADNLRDTTVEEDEILNSHDVVALFTNTPIDLTLRIIRERLESDKDLSNRTLLNIDDIIELTRFSLSTVAYFRYSDVIYRQCFGMAMGSPLSPIGCNIFMEWLEQQAITTAPISCRPRLWRRYVDDVLEIIRKGEVDNLTDHLNQTDPSGSIRFTYEQEQNGCIPFLDTLIMRKPDGSVKLCIYRKKTHTDQYLQFASHHPLHQKLGVIRTLLDRSDSIVTEDADRVLEEQHIKKALATCGYPEWTINKVKSDKQKRLSKTTATKKNDKDKSKGLVVVPYVSGVSERIARVYKKHGFATSFKPHKTLRQMLVHPKDKLDHLQKAETVYEIPCAGCPKTYIGETGRAFGTRLQEHKKDVSKFEKKPYTRSTRKDSTADQHKSAITDHVAATNHAINWTEAKTIDRESDKTTRWIKEAIWIRRRGERKTLNKDEGAYTLHNIYDQLVGATPSTTVLAFGNGKSKIPVAKRQSCQSDEAASLAVKRN